MTWKDMKLEKAIRLIKIEEEDELELVMRQLAVCLDKTYDDIENMEPNLIFAEYNKWVFINSLPEMKRTPVIKIKRKRYGMMDLNKLTMAQMIDIEEFYGLGFIDNLHRIMSILYLPIKRWNPFNKKYNLEEYEFSEERAELFLKETEMDFIWSNLLFFYHIEMAFIDNLKVSLVDRQMKDLMENQNMMKDLFKAVDLMKSEEDKTKTK
jgi:hypothetical protein